MQCREWQASAQVAILIIQNVFSLLHMVSLVLNTSDLVFFLSKLRSSHADSGGAYLQHLWPPDGTGRRSCCE